jgi:flagellar hook-associated protein 2
MSISFSGLGSGIDTSSWITSLTALKNAKVETLTAQKTVIETQQEALSNIKSFFSSFRTLIEKVTDTKFNISSMDLFAQKLVTSSNTKLATASATSSAVNGSYDVSVQNLASETKATSGGITYTTIVTTTTATDDTKLTDIGVNISSSGSSIKVGTTTINLTKNDTIGTFATKLQNAGYEASYNSSTGIFTTSVCSDEITDTSNTQIADKLHLDKSSRTTYSSSFLGVEQGGGGNYSDFQLFAI